MIFAMNSPILAKAAPTSTDPSLDPTVLVLIGAVLAFIVFLVAFKIVYAIFSGVAVLAEALVAGLIRIVFATGGVGALIVVGFVVYLVVVLPNQGGTT